MYNLSKNNALTQPSLIVKLLSYGKRTTKNSLKINPGYPVRKHGEGRVPLAVQVLTLILLLMPCAEAQGSLLYLRRKRSNIPCWVPSNLSICKITTTQVFLPAIFKPIPSQHLLPLVRPSFIPFLLYYCRGLRGRS